MNLFKCIECGLEVKGENMKEVDFVGCSKCSKTLCEECGKTDGSKPFCEKCFTKETICLNDQEGEVVFIPLAEVE